MGVTYGEYRSRLDGTYQGLADPAVREGLRVALGEGFLFTDELDHLLDILRDEQRNGKRLYARFSKRMTPILDSDAVEHILADPDHPKHGEVLHAVVGKERHLSVPTDTLRQLSDRYIAPFAKQLPMHDIAHGGRKGRTAAGSLLQHMPMRSALTFDIEAAFDNISPEYVFNTYAAGLARYGFSEEQLRDTAGWLTMASTVSHGKSRCLPTGAPHSMALFNAAWFSIDDELATKAAKRGFKVTRWVDDVVVSSAAHVPVAQMEGALGVVRQHFPISNAKTFYQQGKIFALGYVVEDGIVRKNNALQRIVERPAPLQSYAPAWE